MTEVWHIMSPQALADARAAIRCHRTSSLTSGNSWRSVMYLVCLRASSLNLRPLAVIFLGKISQSTRIFGFPREHGGKSDCLFRLAAS